MPESEMSASSWSITCEWRRQRDRTPQFAWTIPAHQDASIIGPTDLAREAQSPSGLAPPQTDHGALPTLKRCFADSYNRLEERGWARQATDPV
jgi:hypothetical protein